MLKHRSSYIYFKIGKFCIDEFTYNENLLQTVSNYCYHDLTLKCNGSSYLATTVLMEKARKALRSRRQLD